MPVLVQLDAARLFRWHLLLLAAIARRTGEAPAVAFAAGRRPLDPALVALLLLEETLASRNGRHPLDRIDPTEMAPFTGSRPTAPELVIDLSDGQFPPGDLRTLTPLYDGLAGSDAFWSALLDGRAPRLAIDDSAGPAIAVGQAAVENPHALRKSAAAVATRLVTALARAATAPPSAGGPSAKPHTPAFATPAMSGAATLLARKVQRKAMAAVEAAVSQPLQWATAWRRVPADALLPTGLLTGAGFHLLADDGRRYYADPFPFAQASGLDLFVEELPYATGRGVISVTRLRADGKAVTPRPVLELDHHLSYPQIIQRGGDLFMLPECHASGGLTLYRAVHYPDAWEPVARLIDHPVHDATLFEHGGRLWITAAGEGEEGFGSSWDNLCLYWAHDLLGPWTPHPVNPVLLDLACARPAGNVTTIGGRLVRPVQDCRRGYGAALGLAAIVRLDGEAYVQEMVGHLTMPEPSGLAGPHTLNRAPWGEELIEAVDVYGRAGDIRRWIGGQSEGISACDVPA